MPRQARSLPMSGPPLPGQGLSRTDWAEHRLFLGVRCLDRQAFTGAEGPLRDIGLPSGIHGLFQAAYLRGVPAPPPKEERPRAPPGTPAIADQPAAPADAANATANDNDDVDTDAKGIWLSLVETGVSTTPLKKLVLGGTHFIFP